MKRRKLKIVSDGTGAGTFFSDAETGEDLLIPCSRITWDVSAAHLSECQVTIYGVELEVVGVVGAIVDDGERQS